MRSEYGEVMEQFRAVKIIHSISDRLDFLFLAEFFHFCGLYVGEEILGSTDFDPVQDVICCEL